MAQKVTDPKELPIVKQSLALLQRLLTPARTRTELVSGRPIVPASAVGALVVVGMKTTAPKAWVSVYIYRTYNEATAGLSAVKAAAGPTEGKWTISAVNGRMVLYGHSADVGAGASLTRYVLNNILVAFDEDC